MTPRNNIHKLVGIELFSGAGGMSLGAAMAGVDVKLAVEINKSTAATYAFNHKSTRVINEDVANIHTVDVKKGKLCSVLFGGPPCQGFSMSNRKTRNSLNPKNWQFKQFIKVVELWKPDWVVMENVSGLLKTEKGFFLEMIIEDLKLAGYETSCIVLNAVNYGIPQKRERLFIVGSIDGITLKSPIVIPKKVTVEEAISDLPILENGSTLQKAEYKTEAYSDYAKLMRMNASCVLNNGVSKNNELVISRYKHIPQGGNWSNIPESLMSNYKDRSRCHGGIYYRLKQNDASVVIGNYRKNMLIHPIQDRGLSVREAARLQSFPDSFEFKGILNDQQQQVGDAVPPLLSKAIFDTIIASL